MCQAIQISRSANVNGEILRSLSVVSANQQACTRADLAVLSIVDLFAANSQFAGDFGYRHRYTFLFAFRS
jgi:hypothetical protein